MGDARRRRRRAAGAAGIALVLVAGLIWALSRERGQHAPSGLRSPARTTQAVLPAPQHAPGPRAEPPPSGEAFGADVNRTFENAAFTPGQVQAQLAALQATGATIARTDALWEFTEPTAPTQGRHRYDWSFDDRVAAQLASHHIRWLPIIDYSPGWAQSVPGQVHSPPRVRADYADYAAAFAARYGPGGPFWAAHPALPALVVGAIEVWNEPDNPTFWMPAPDPARYAALYQLTRDTVAATAPKVDVIIGGLWHAESFMPRLLAADPALAGHLDGISMHPYGRTPAAIVDHVVAVRRLLSAAGMGAVPLYVTEFGWTTSPPGARDYLSESLRPGYLAATLAGLGRVGCGVAAVVAYTWVTERANLANSEQWYGITDPAGTRTPDAAAFTLGVGEARRLSRTPGPCAAAVG